MARLHRYYVIPIEFFTKVRRSKVESAWKEKYLSLLSMEEYKTFFLIADNAPSLYKLPTEWPDGTVFFDGSGACLVISDSIDDWHLTEQAIIDELAYRANKHNDLIAVEKQSWLDSLIKSSKSAIGHDDFPIPSINYVFGFYLLETTEKITTDERRLIKILAEPSIIGIEDMVPCTDAKKYSLTVATKGTFLDQVVDRDISANAELYVTWATLVSVVETPSLRDDTIDMLVSLEVRLQLVWNRCYTISNFADAIFSSESKYIELNKFYWSFVNSLDDAKSVLTSTLSSRANSVFEELIKTSKVAGEIARLKDKVDLLEKYLHQQREKTSLKYQRTIEALLFVTALSQVVPLFFQLPVFTNQFIGEITIGMLFILGLIAILKR